VRGARGSESGFTILEVVVAAAVLAVGLLGLLSAIPSGLKLLEASRATQIALTTIRSKIEEMRGTTFANVYATFNGQAVIAFRDKNGNGAYDAGEESLPFVSGQTSHGSVTFLTEAQAAAAWGIGSCDLNADGDSADTPPGGGVSGQAAFVVLPVSITFQWKTGKSDTSSITVRDMIFDIGP
jgi:type II secretory pathway pseudopilin PulG